MVFDRSCRGPGAHQMTHQPIVTDEEVEAALDAYYKLPGIQTGTPAKRVADLRRMRRVLTEGRTSRRPSDFPGDLAASPAPSRRSVEAMARDLAAVREPIDEVLLDLVQTEPIIDVLRAVVQSTMVLAGQGGDPQLFLDVADMLDAAADGCRVQAQGFGAAE